ncbi:N-acetyltransferase 8 [Desmophyllum pertusum]|uniref:N-acetyltransferase 8 n=1 Tax=Desmophyllum pertusum TaxID=174260 RepID=A0A9W9YSZ8_9CNID|nr:N-acetyltransferase 8 [Desmophyllum pertusum]
MDSSDNREYQNLSHSYPTAKDAVTIRSFQRSDHKECLQICLDGWQEFIRNITLDVLSKSFWYVAIATVFTSLAAVLWSAWIFVVHVLIVFILCALFCIILQLSSWQLTNNWLRTDLKDIEKSYMSDEGSSHMWVAELHGKVVGMVGLIHNDSDGPGANELRRISEPSQALKGFVSKFGSSAVSVCQQGGRSHEPSMFAPRSKPCMETDHLTF